MKKKVSFILVLSILFYSTAFAGSSKLIGKWEDTDVKNDFLEFLDEETIIIDVGSRKITITYKLIKDNLFKFEMMGQRGVCEFMLDGDKLSFTSEYDCAWSKAKFQRKK